MKYIKHILFAICLLLICSISLKAEVKECYYSSEAGSISIEVTDLNENFARLTYQGSSLPEYAPGKDSSIQIGPYKFYSANSTGVVYRNGDNCPDLHVVKNENKMVICSNTCGNASGDEFTNVSFTNTGSKNINSNNTSGSALCTKLNMLWTIFGYIIFGIQVIAPLVLIVVGSLGMAKAVTSDNPKQITEAQELLIKRIIAAVLLFLIIFITKLVVNLILGSDYETEWQSCVHCTLNPFDSGCGIIETDFVITEGN